jgi:rubrerythrin
MDIQREVEVAKSAQWTNADELKYPSDFYAVLRLMKQHGDVKLSQILATFRPLGFICPQCNGTGKVIEKYATDSLAVATGCADWSYRDADCPLCKGTGAVPKKLNPRMVQDGWEEA